MFEVLRRSSSSGPRNCSPPQDAAEHRLARAFSAHFHARSRSPVIRARAIATRSGGLPAHSSTISLFGAARNLPNAVRYRFIPWCHTRWFAQIFGASLRNAQQVFTVRKCWQPLPAACRNWRPCTGSVRGLLGNTPLQQSVADCGAKHAFPAWRSSMQQQGSRSKSHRELPL